MKSLRHPTWLLPVCCVLISACAPAAPSARAPTFEPPPVVPTATSEATLSAPTAEAGATAATGAVTATIATDPSQLKASLDAWVPAAIQSNGGTACSVAVVHPDASGQLKTDFYNYGTLSKDSATPVDSSTVYEIGSVTKLFASDLLAVFVVGGQAALGDSIKSYLPSSTWVPSYATQEITLQQLSTHTSGLPPDFVRNLGPITVNSTPVLNYVPAADVIRSTSTYQLLRAPGSHWEYSNLGYALLGVIEERVGVTTFDNLVQNKIDAPLGLTSTRALLTPDERSRLAQGYTSDGKQAIQYTDVGAMVAAGGLRSTAADLAKYLIANLQPAPDKLGPALRLTLQTQDKGPDATSAMGLGWIIGQAGTPQAVYYKDGVTDGYSSYIAFWPSTEVAFALLCNGQAAQDLAPKISTALGGPNTPVDTSQ